MIAAMCHLYRVTQNATYLHAAEKAQAFTEEHLNNNQTTYYVSKGHSCQPATNTFPF
jgi:uncharacterized protein YyaL (SSP411 family)